MASKDTSVRTSPIGRSAVGAEPDRFVAFDLRTLRIDSTLTFDLHIRYGKRYVLYRHQDLSFDQRTRAALIDNNVDTLFVTGDDARDLARYFELHLADILSDDRVPVNERARSVINVAENLAADILENPEARVTRRALHMVEKLASFAVDSPEVVSRLLNLLSDGSTLQAHSANVAALALVFSRHAPDPTIEGLAKLSLAGLLHDAGLSLVSPDILNKPAPLDDKERLLVEQHPVTGEQILRQLGHFSDDVMAAVRHHHERLDGSGYPEGRSGRAIPWMARVIAIAEVFDSLTSDQPFRERVKPDDALKLMVGEMSGQLDLELIRALIPALVERAGDGAEDK